MDFGIPIQRNGCYGSVVAVVPANWKGMSSNPRVGLCDEKMRACLIGFLDFVVSE